MKNPIIRFSFIVIALAFASCASKKDVLYLQDLEADTEQDINQSYVSLLQPDDILSITVSSVDNVGIEPFNIVTTTSNVGVDVAGGNQRLANYIIRNDGTIEFPVLGKLKIAGMTTLEVVDFIKLKLKRYLKEPIVIVEWLNFKYTVIGEVQRPGVFSSTGERVSILEAIGNAGDLNIYGNRKDIILIRENNGVQKYYTVDLTSKEFLSSEVYYLKQNDVILVSPNNAQVQSSAYNRNTPIYISTASVLISLAILLTR